MLTQNSERLNFSKIWGVLRRRAPLVALCAFVVAGAAFFYSTQQTKEYTATAALIFNSDPVAQQILGFSPDSSSSQFIQQSSNVELVGLGDTAAKTASQLGLTEQRVRGSLSIAGQGESNVVSVSATTPSPLLASRIANEYVHQFVVKRQKANQAYFKSALALVNKQLAALPPVQRFGPAAIALQNRAQTLKLLASLHYGSVEVAGNASVPTSPSSPKTLKNTVIGLMLGLLIGLGLAFVLERFDDELGIRDPRSLEEIYRKPILGVVPESGGLARAEGEDPKWSGFGPIEEEAFQMIRARLSFLNPNRPVRSVLIASAAFGEGATTVGRSLAEVNARTGSRVLLLEANLRRPTLSRQLNLEARPGLANVLVGDIPLKAAISSVELDQAEGVAGGCTLDVLTGSAPGFSFNPVALIESRAMDDMLEQARATYDLVVIDVPPLTIFSDAFSLLGKVDGVVVVSRIRPRGRELDERLSQMLDDSGAWKLGVIVNRAKRRREDLPTDRFGRERSDETPSHPSINGTLPAQVSTTQIEA